MRNCIQPAPDGKRFGSLEEARGCAPVPGDIVVLRDFARVAPADVWTREPTRGKWHLRPYRLTDGQSGRLLMVNDRAADEPETAVPPEIEIPLDLPGWYAIWVGVPHLDQTPRLGGMMGVDVALDGEPGYVHVKGEAGVRKGRLMLPANIEMMRRWKYAPLAGRTLDFIGVQAWDQARYRELAKRYHTPYYMAHDQDPFDVPGGWRDDAVWQEGGANEDPLPGEEWLEQPPLNSSLDPTEYDRGLLERYRLGIDGVCLVNAAGRNLGRLGHLDDMAARAAAGAVWGQETGPGIELE